ncbi:hypothetical protein BC834DRAFT_621822 [Gloeopeniophorella convolvens]|nr:hypothetical protein BC834DRAFT_621822 [Gloeopeniophorella convolvens]
MPLTASQVRTAITSKPWTKDLLHMQPFPLNWLKRHSFKDPVVKAVKPQDRIKYWNIVPGDRVRVIGDKEEKLLEVAKINKLSNRVYLKGGKPKAGKEGDLRNVHYSRCQLFIGDFEFPAQANSTEPRTLPVFATRVGTSNPFWHPMLARYHWDRFAAGTTPRLPTAAKTTGSIKIPWPKQPDRPKQDATIYTSKAEDVTAITYVPFALPADTDAAVSEIDENKYIQSVLKPDARPYDPAVPVEIHLSKELSNPHSRAKKQRRWQAALTRQRELLKVYVQNELKDLKGRTRHEARAEAVWKWRERLAADIREEKKRRWIHRGGEAAVERRKVRRARKERKQDERLRGLVLKDAPNQVIPTATL